MPSYPPSAYPQSYTQSEDPYRNSYTHSSRPRRHSSYSSNSTSSRRDRHYSSSHRSPHNTSSRSSNRPKDRDGDTLAKVALFTGALQVLAGLLQLWTTKQQNRQAQRAYSESIHRDEELRRYERRRERDLHEKFQRGVREYEDFRDRSGRGRIEGSRGGYGDYGQHGGYGSAGGNAGRFTPAHEETYARGRERRESDGHWDGYSEYGHSEYGQSESGRDGRKGMTRRISDRAHDWDDEDAMERGNGQGYDGYAGGRR